MQFNTERRCTNCRHKSTCSTFKDVKGEKTASGWDLNRFAIYCEIYKEKE